MLGSRGLRACEEESTRVTTNMTAAAASQHPRTKRSAHSCATCGVQSEGVLLTRE